MNQLIGIYSSVPHSGKSEVAKILSKHGYIIHPFARPVKEISTLFIQVTAGLSKKSAEKFCYSAKAQQIPGLPDGTTGRTVMQRIGTDFSRIFYDDIWVETWKREVKTYCNMFCVVADDMRFENEANAIREMGGKLWLVTRPGVIIDSAVEHCSEGRLSNVEFDVHIINDGSIAQLEKKVLEKICKIND